MFWLLGSFSGVRWPEFQLALVVVLAGLAVCLYYSRALDAFTFGDDAAASLGIAVPQVRGLVYHHRPDHRDHRQHGGLYWFCRAGRAARYAFPVRAAAPTLLIASALAGRS